MVNHSAITTDRSNPTPASPRRHLARTLWQWLGGNPLLGLVGGLIFLLYLGAALIQQMPGQIADDPAAATRWLLTLGEEYGVFGNVLRTLGLFDVRHNPVLQLLLAIIALIILVRLGNTLATLWRFWQSAQWLTIPGVLAGMPLSLPSTQSLYRLRQATTQMPAALATQLTQELTPQFAEVLSTTLSVTAPPMAIVETRTTPSSASEVATGESAPATERRLLARRHYVPWLWLQPLFYGGLLLALAAIWIILLAGWEITPPPLAPGEQYRATTQRVTLSYTILEHGDELAPTLGVEMADSVQQVPLGEKRWLQLGQVTLQANAGPPALWISSKEAAVTLSRPSQSQNTMDLGLIFPTLGSEDSVVVENRVGLRIVRVAVLPEAIKANASDDSHNTTDSPLGTAPHEQFLVEVYQPDAGKPVQTIVVSGPATAKIQVSGKVRELRFVPISSMAAAVRYQPAIWLLWVALMLVVVGAIGYCYRPAFLLLQLAPWPTGRTVVVAQSDVAAEIERLRLALR